jgi:hypothetical protein
VRCCFHRTKLCFRAVVLFMHASSVFLYLLPSHFAGQFSTISREVVGMREAALNEKWSETISNNWARENNERERKLMREEERSRKRKRGYLGGQEASRQPK